MIVTSGGMEAIALALSRSPQPQTWFVVMAILALVRNYLPSHDWVLKGGWNIADCAARSYDTAAGYNHRGIDYFVWQAMTSASGENNASSCEPNTQDRPPSSTPNTSA